MGRELGRISGPLLADNLLRNGNDLAFETSLLYLNVTGDFIGVNTDTPAKALDINGTSYIPTVLVDTEADFSELYFTTNQVQNLFDVINIQPNQSGSPNIVVPGLGTDKLTFRGNTLTDYVSNDDISINPTGQLVIGTSLANNNVLVNGTLHATGNVTFDGNIVLGSGPGYTIAIPAEIDSNIIPQITNTYNLGSSSLYWETVYSNALTTGAITTQTITNTTSGTFTIGNVSFGGIGDNNITDVLSGDTLQFSTSGTGVINLNNTITIKQGTITYSPTDTPLTFDFAADPNTGAQNGYLYFSGSNGFVPPVGTTAQRPLNPPLGTLRFNTDLSILEVYANVPNSVTSFNATTNARSNSGTSIIYTIGTTGMKVGDLVTGISLPGAFSANTLITSINPGVSFNISSPLLLTLPSGSTVNALQQWVPSIGLSPVLSADEVTETMDIWTLILG